MRGIEKERKKRGKTVDEEGNYQVMGNGNRKKRGDSRRGLADEGK